MHKIQMVDLVAQYDKVQNEIDQAVLDVIRSSQYINGPEVKSFQSELENYLDVKHVIPCANGTDALQVAMMALDLKPGDEVITSDFTFAATVEVIGLLGLTPVLVDVDPETYNIDPKAIEAAISEKTKAIVPVHIFGQCADMDAIMDIAKKHDLRVIEDTAQAIGAKYRSKNGNTYSAGCMGDIGTTSFFPSKNLGCYGDGGAIFTNDDDLASAMRSIVNHGMGKRYYYDRLGVNSRLDSIQAAILRIKLRHLDNYIAVRQKAAAYYSEHLNGFNGIVAPKIDEKSTHVFHQYTLVREGVDQFKLQEFLSEKGIPCMIYYPMPLHVQEAYKQVFMNDDDNPVTNRLCNCVFSLPMHTELSTEQLEFIVASVKEYFSE